MARTETEQERVVAIPVLKCKECLFWRWSNAHHQSHYCSMWNWHNTAEDYCSFGVKKLEEEE